MSNKRYDPITTTKLISKYIEALSDNKKQKEALTAQLNDLKITIDLNQSILFDFISSSASITPDITALLTECKDLWAENERLFDVKSKFRNEIGRLKELIEDSPNDLREKLVFIEAENSKMNILLSKKDKTIKQLRQDLDKSRSLFKTSKREIVVTVPTENSLSLYHELLTTKILLDKVATMHQMAKQKTKELITEVKVLQGKLALMQKNARDDYACSTEVLRSKFSDKSIDKAQANRNCNGNSLLLNGSNHVKHPITNKPIVPLINFSKLNGTEKNFNADLDLLSSSNTADEMEESNDDEDGQDEHKPKRGRPKKKELEMLHKEYGTLKAQNESYEKKIDKLKGVYKELKDKISNISPVVKAKNLTDRKMLLSSTDDTLRKAD